MYFKETMQFNDIQFKSIGVKHCWNTTELVLFLYEMCGNIYMCTLLTLGAVQVDMSAQD